jgi:NAD(P)-dependent dehydrogenase (short-subunit alcohol dehydrogenase family)
MNQAATGPVALVSGGAGGLGAGVCRGLARRGAVVLVADRDADGAEACAEACRALGADARALVADLATAEGPAAMVEAALDRCGRVDVLVNNAGWGACERFLDITAASWDRTFDVNVRGLVLAVVAAGRHMAARGSGRIVNVTSPASRMALPDYAAYAASKAAVDSITRAAAVALAPRGVLVNAIAPGMMDTELQRRTEAQLAALAGRDDLERFLAERTGRIPLGRRATVEEIAAGVVWLALDAPAYLTSERLNLSGGLDRD